MWKFQKFSPIWKFFRQINIQIGLQWKRWFDGIFAKNFWGKIITLPHCVVTYLVKALLSRNFCQKEIPVISTLCGRECFVFPHRVPQRTVLKKEKFSIAKKKFVKSTSYLSCFMYVSSENVTFTKFCQKCVRLNRSNFHNVRQKGYWLLISLISRNFFAKTFIVVEPFT